MLLVRRCARDWGAIVAGKAWLSEQKKVAILADSVVMTKAQLSRKYCVHARTITRVLEKAKEELPSCAATQNVQECRERIRGAAYVALEDGLQHKADPYRRGALGVAALKGLGEFQTEGQTTVNALIARVPAEWRERFLVPLAESDAE